MTTTQTVAQPPQMVRQEPDTEETQHAPLTADELTEAALTAIEKLGPLAEKVRNVMDFYVAYPPQDKLDPAEVETELPVTIKRSKEDLITDAAAVEQVLSDEKDVIAGMFAQMTSKPFDRVDLDAFQKEFEREMREQADKRQLLNSIIKDVTDLSGRFGIPNPDPTMKPQRPKTALDTARAAFAKGMETVVPALTRDVEKKEQAGKLYYSWTSELTLTASHPAVVRLNILKKSIAGVDDLVKIEAKLASKRLGKDDRPELFTELMTLARQDQQIVEQTEGNVGREFEEIRDEVNAVSQIENYTQYVLRFFPSEKNRPKSR